VNENGKKEKNFSYACGTTEDREPTHSGSYPDTPNSIWRSAFYFPSSIHAPESLNEQGSLSMGWLKSKDLCHPILY